VIAAAAPLVTMPACAPVCRAMASLARDCSSAMSTNAPAPAHGSSTSGAIRAAPQPGQQAGAVDALPDAEALVGVQGIAPGHWILRMNARVSVGLGIVEDIAGDPSSTNPAGIHEHDLIADLARETKLVGHDDRGAPADSRARRSP